MKKRILRLSIGLILLIFSALAGVIFFLTITDYRPDKTEKLSIIHGGILPSFNDSIITILTWNIGYAGLGSEMDFFYDGGKMVRPDYGNFNNYLRGICNVVKKNNKMDFMFLQEVDVHSKRSYFTDEADAFAANLEDFGYSFAKNYDCKYVPVPVFQPMGRVVSGIITFSRFKPSLAERFDYGTRFSWPTGMVMLKRCYLIMRFPLQSGKELVLINTHNSVFDSGAVLRKKELKILHSCVLDEFNRGNYVIIGGDFNMNPRGFNPDSVSTGDKVHRVIPPISEDFLPGWKFLFDNSSPSNRDVNEPYRKGKTGTTIIDFFVVSPNIEAIQVNTVQQEFAVSDHNPVAMKVRLRY